ncbi:MAG TPA: hypothetical protein VEK57_03300 [Thermoanaerobaculia bacterium]|nr:hypothetical protein [Thermoanaerobaculia bacterium]
MDNLERLRQLYDSNRCAKAVLDDLASRGDEAVTTVERVREALAGAGTSCSRREVIAVFKKLHRIGTGFFIVGRRSRPSRFAPIESLSLAEIGHAARGDSAPGRDRAPGPGAADLQPAGVIVHRFVLRPDFLLTVELPSDLTRAEAARISEFIKSLPFG